jgi:hypothetical protein
MAIHVTPIPITAMAHPDLSDVTTAQHHTKYTSAEAIAAVEGESTLVLSGTVAGLTLAGAADANAQAINNIGAAGHDITSAGAIIQGNASALTARNTTNPGISYIGQPNDVYLSDNETITFTFIGSGAFFQVTNRSNTYAGVFYVTYGPATVTQVAGNTDFTLTDTDNSNTSIFKPTSSQTVSVKNYTNGGRYFQILVFGHIGSATAPA